MENLAKALEKEGFDENTLKTIQKLKTTKNKF